MLYYIHQTPLSSQSGDETKVEQSEIHLGLTMHNATIPWYMTGQTHRAGHFGTFEDCLGRLSVIARQSLDKNLRLLQTCMIVCSKRSSLSMYLKDSLVQPDRGGSSHVSRPPFGSGNETKEGDEEGREEEVVITHDADCTLDILIARPIKKGRSHLHNFVLYKFLNM